MDELSSDGVRGIPASGKLGERLRLRFRDGGGDGGRRAKNKGEGERSGTSVE